MTKPIDIGAQLAVARRLAYVADILDGFSDGIDYDRLHAGMNWVRRGLVQPEPPQDLIALFASVHIAFNEDGLAEGEEECDPVAEALKDIERVGAEAAAIGDPAAPMRQAVIALACSWSTEDPDDEDAVAAIESLPTKVNEALAAVISFASDDHLPDAEDMIIDDAAGLLWFEQTFGVPLGDRPGAKDVERVVAARKRAMFPAREGAA